MLVASHPISDYQPPSSPQEALEAPPRRRPAPWWASIFTIPNDLPAMAGIKTIHDVRVYHAGVYNSIFVKKRVKKS